MSRVDELTAIVVKARAAEKAYSHVNDGSREMAFSHADGSKALNELAELLPKEDYDVLCTRILS